MLQKRLMLFMSFVPSYKLTDAKYYTQGSGWQVLVAPMTISQESVSRRGYETCAVDTFIRANNVPNNWPTDDLTFGKLQKQCVGIRENR